MKHLIWIVFAFSMLFAGCQRVDYKEANEIIELTNRVLERGYSAPEMFTYYWNSQDDNDAIVDMIIQSALLDIDSLSLYAEKTSKYPDRYKEYLNLRIEAAKNGAKLLSKTPKKSDDISVLERQSTAGHLTTMRLSAIEVRLKEYKDIEDDILSHKEDKK